MNKNRKEERYESKSNVRKILGDFIDTHAVDDFITTSILCCRGGGYVRDTELLTAEKPGNTLTSKAVAKTSASSTEKLLATTQSTGVTEISTAEDFAAMSPSGNYILTGDITVTASYNGTFKGTFDGDGHTVTLNLTVTSGNAGLFKETGNGATIKNLVVNAAVTSSVTGSSNGTAGLVGYVNYPITLENCGVTGTITNNSTSSSNYVSIGGLVGYLNDTLTMTNCYSTADITSLSKYSSSAAGGLIGRCGSSASVTAKNCYATGNITAQAGYGGGFAGYGNANYKTYNYENCYAAGTVSIGTSNSNAYGFAYVYGSQCTITNSFYNAANTKGYNGTSGGPTGKTLDELKALDSSTLGEAFQSDTTNLNNGLPILDWQYVDPTAKATVTIKVTPADSVLTWNGQAQAVSADGTYTFPDVAVGNYDYTVTNEADDYAPQLGSISVKGKAVTKDIKLELNKHNLSFTLTPSNAAFTLKQGETTIAPTTTATGSRTYSVVNGTYTYEASAFGYKTKTGSVTVNKGNVPETVTLEAQPLTTLTFAYSNSAAQVNSGKFVVQTTDNKIMTAKAGSNGFVYELPAGYKYTYTFTSANYAKQTGEIDLTAVNAVQEKTETITLTEKTAWEGAADITEPSKDDDGVYQISSGSELAWLAQQINSGKNATCSAVLTKDIDLGKENWTPIGKSTSYAFKGSFDGAGHTIKNLNVEGRSTSTNYGLFGYVNGGTVRNLTVEGNITISGNGGTSYGVGGIVGYFYGTTGTIENCVNKAVVSGSQNVGGIVGYVRDGSSTATKQIKNCANLADISSNSNKAAGIVGYVYGQITVDSCYNRGKCTSGSWYAGGITAQINDSNAKIQNCYSTGTVSVTSGSDAHAIVGKKSSGTVSDCYYLNTVLTDSNATAKTADELKGLAATLGDSFVTAPANLNDGYPVLRFQIPTYEAAFTTNIKNAVVEIEGYTGITDGNGIWTFTLPDGKYTYKAYAYGKVEQNGDITVSKQAVEKQITFADAQTKTVKFNITPKSANATIQLVWNGQTVESGTNTSYDLPYGTYQYTVKAKGYARATGALVVNDSTADVTVKLVESQAWDGNEKEEPTTGAGTAASPYEIDNGAQLAWLAAKVNKDGGTIHAKLTSDIDLGNQPWTPIGSSTKAYAGTFDGGGNTVSGLSVSDVDYGGLFGVVKNAEIKNIIVQGKVSATSNAGGIAGRMTAASTFTNCGNEAAVSAPTGSSAYAGGILGNNNTSDVLCTMSGCYNSGAVNGNYRSGGLLGNNSGKLTISDCYNTGEITSDSYAGGIVAGGSATIKNSYNSSTVTGKTSYALGTTGYGNSCENCFYLEETGAVLSSGTTKVTSAKLQAATISEAFETVAGRNNGYPVLKWQKLKPVVKEAVLAKNIEFVQEPAYIPSFHYTEGMDEDDYRFSSTKLTWDAIDGASSYAVFLFSYQESNYTKDNYTETITQAKQITVSETQCDLKEQFASLDEGVYYAAVVPVDADNSFATPTTEQVRNEIISNQIPYDRMKSVTGLKWNGTVAKWTENSYDTSAFGSSADAGAGFGIPEDTSMMYTVKLYKVTGTEANPTYEQVKALEIPYGTSNINLANVFTAGNSYAFTVTLHTNSTQMARYGLTDSPESEMSPTYKPEESTKPGGDHTGWTAISSASDWIKLANVEDVPSVSGDSSSPSKQAVEWSKDYYLTADLDFSKLTAEEQAKTKTLGNVTNRFMGTIDGNGHTIKGLTLSNKDSGLFGYVGSTGYIYDLKIENANVLFSDNAAVVAHNNYGIIENCAVINCNITADTGAVLGGMVSRNYGVIRNSYVQDGELRSNSQTATGHAGFVGANEDGALIERCWTSMDVYTSSDYAGGFVGLGYGGTIQDCFALGDVSARSYSGGFVGRSVYSGNTYENCYAAGEVTTTESNGHGFIGGNKPDSAFQYDQSSGITNCYYNSDSPADVNCAGGGKSLDEMKESAFLSALNQTGAWSQAADKNNGLPYLTAVAVPQKTQTERMTAQISLATYDKETYSFQKMGETINVTMESNGNTRLVDLMDAAVEQDKLTYVYDTTTSYGRYIKTINGYEVTPPDGWMFTINDKLSNVSASLATVTDGDHILWFEGTTENHFQGPTLAELAGTALEWVDIRTVKELQVLAAATDAETLAKNYRLTADIDLAGVAFNGIGSADKPFTGIFDGQNHTVSNLNISQNTANAGFFRVVKGATIKNLKLENAAVSGTEKVGAMVGWAQVALDKNDSAKNKANLIGNCTVSGTVKGTKQVGGIVGLNDGKQDPDTLFSIESAVDKCSFDGTVTGSGSSSEQLGGVAGANAGTITKSAAAGEVTATDGKMVGGFVGSNTGSIYDSHTSAAVTGQSSVGGFVGTGNGSVKNGYSLGAVTGTDYTGSFAGSIANAEFVIGAGQVTIRGTQSSGYVGGFAGSLSGILTGTTNMITVKDAYGNCTTSSETPLPVIGNAAKYNSEVQKAVLEQMTLSTQKEVNDKLFEMFGINTGSLAGEAEKYVDSVRVPAATASGSSISLLKAGQTAGTGITVALTYDSDYLSGTDSLTLAKQNETLGVISIPLTLKLTSAEGSYSKKITVYLEAAAEKMTALMDNIAQTLTASDDAWAAMDMAAYAKLAGKTAATTAEAKQNVINLLIAKAADDEATAADRSKIEIVLRALGADSNQLYVANSNKKFSNAQKLQALDTASIAQYHAPYVLLADLQDNVKLTAAQKDTLMQMLLTNVGEGLFESEWDGVNYKDPDTAGAALAALAPYYSSNNTAKAIVDKILAALPAALDEKGSLGNANSDAMVITGLIALGKDPAAQKNAAGMSLVDGLLSHVNAGGNGFLYRGSDNALATEQGFRALVALHAYAANGNKAYNIYDYSSNAVEPARATGTGETTPPQTPTGTDINVSVTIKTDTETWLNNHSVTVPGEGATVYHALKKAADDASITLEGAESGYVKSMTKDGRKLGEFDKGENSGWMYKVNGENPNVGLTSKSISNGDNIVWFYTTDWKKEPGSEQWTTPVNPDSGGSDAEKVTTSDGAEKVTTSPTEVDVQGDTATATVTDDNAAELVKQAGEKKSDEIVIKVEASATGKASEIKAELSASTVQDIVGKTEAVLTVKTAEGEVTMDRTSLEGIAKSSINKGAKKVSIIVAKRTVSDEEKTKYGKDLFSFEVKLVLSGSIQKRTSGTVQINAVDTKTEKDMATAELGGGKVTVKVPLGANAPDKLYAARENADGSLIGINGEIKKKEGKAYYEFTTKTLGRFLFAKEQLADKTEGEETTDKQEQEITVSKDKITKRYGAKAFSLGAQANTELSYKSSNAKVVTVTSSGKVRIKGTGNAKITIRAAESDTYKAAEKTVTIKVNKAKQTVKIKKNVRSIKRAAVAKKARTYTFTTTGKKTALKAVKLTKAQKKAIKSVKISGNKVKVTVKKGAKKGTYKLKVYAAQGKNYKASAKKVITIRVK